MDKECGQCGHARKDHRNYLGVIGGHGVGYDCWLCKCKRFRLGK